MECDQKDFFMNEKMAGVNEYAQMAMIQAIHHLLKPSEEDARIGEKRYKIFKILDKIFKLSFKVYIAYFLLKKLDCILLNFI